MWALVVVKANPVSNATAGMLQALKAVAVHTLLLEAANHTLDHAVLLRAVWRNELVLHPIAFHQGRKVAANTSTLSERSRNGSIIFPKVPDLAIKP